MRKPAPDELAALSAVLNFERNGPPIEEKLALLGLLRQQEEVSPRVDRCLLDRLGLLHKGLLSCQENHRKLEGVLEKFSAPPWFPALFLGPVASPKGPRALVRQGATERIVGFAEGEDPAAFAVGDFVYLARELNLVMGRAPAGLGCSGELASFARMAGQGRMVLRSRDEEFVVYATPSLLAANLQPDDLVRWDRNGLVAFEKMEKAGGSHLFLEETPTETFADIGGLGPQIERIKRTFELQMRHGDTARRYRLAAKGSILLHGPAGVGKTLIAKGLANWLAGVSPSGRARFMNIKPGALHSMWYSQSEANYRELFRTARAAAAATPGQPTVLFFDEVDSIGSARGQSHMRVHDNVLTAFIAELDGLVGRGDILVIGATNRREAIDPSLLRPGRLGDLVLEVPRPNRQAARDIFAKHLPADIPYARNGHGEDWAATREEILDATVSTIYSPNGEGELATITFRDGKRRAVRAADLASGAVFANIARSAIERACHREVQTGDGGVAWNDVSSAITEEFTGAARVLCPANCRLHLSGLPQDVDVVSVEPVARKTNRPQRYLKAI